MSIVKQIALSLNIIVPAYFFIYQLFYQQPYSQYQQQTNNLFIHILKASIVLISPMFHILALLSPSYCYKGHCSPPHHYKNSLLESQYPLHPYQPMQSKQISPNVRFNDDLIQQSIASSKDDLHKHQNYLITHNNKRLQLFDKNQKELKSINNFKYQSPERRKQQLQNQAQKNQDINNKKGNKNKGKEDVIFCKLQSPLSLNKYSMSYEQPKQVQATNNVNEFSNIPFFNRSSRKSLSNVGNSQSPRYSRRSIVQATTQQSIAQPLIKLTPVKMKRQQLSNEQKVADFSNKKDYDGMRQQLQLQHQHQYQLNLNGHNNNYFTPYINTKDNNNLLSLPMRIQCQYCQQCHIPKYLRMKHCYRCSKCVHKYDHHCVLLNICIGQRNQKYYIAFLYAHFYNTCIVLSHLLKNIKDDVSIDMATGIQSIDDFYVLKAICIILLLLNFVLTIYLLFIHTRFLFNGLTTYQKERKLTINYFKHIRKHYRLYSILKHMDKQQIQNYHPFDQGPIKNVFKVITASKTPYDWKLPFQQSKQILVEMKDKKQMAKNKQNQHKKIEAYQWGQQSQSSNYLHAGKTTKSRESGGFRKSKQTQQKYPQRKICK